MVLSNKKLKQKLRATLAESLAAKESTVQDEEPHANKSFKQLLESTIPKPRLSKREKRRKTTPLQGSNSVEGSNVNSHTEKEKDINGSEASNEKNNYKDNKKRKRDDNGAQGTENGVPESKVEKLENKPKKKKAKSKKKKKKQNKAEGVKDGIAETKEQPVEVNESFELNSQENADAATKVYVGGIPYYSNEEDIRSFFESCGTITEIDCMRFPETGKFRGIAMITFKTEAAAKRALALDGSDMGGLFLKIQPYKTTRATKSSDFAPEITEGYNRVYVGNLSWDITEEELKVLFSDCKISKIRFGEDKATGEFRGYAHVDFADNLSVTLALKLDEKVVCGRPVRIRCAVPRKEPINKILSSKSENGSVSSIGGKKRRTCYKCGDPGHISSACPNKQAVDVASKNENGGAGGGKKRRTCYECGVPGHISSACPKKQAVDLASPA